MRLSVLVVSLILLIYHGQAAAGKPRPIRIHVRPFCCNSFKSKCNRLTVKARGLDKNAKYFCAVINAIYGPRKPVLVRAVKVNSVTLTCMFPRRLTPSIYRVALAVKGHKPGPYTRVAVYDSRCMDCISGRGVRFHRKTCFLDRKCRKDKEINPRNQLQMCDARKTKMRWSRRDPCKAAGCQHGCYVHHVTFKPICQCRMGYRLHANRKNCKDVNECRLHMHRCQDKCINTEGSYRCECTNGELAPDGKTCLKKDPCADCSHGCEKWEDHAKCTCRAGYKLAEDERTCIDVDECENSNGGCDYKCVNKPGGHTCLCQVKCQEGFVLVNKDHCVPACAVKNGGCSHQCDVNWAGEVECTCPSTHSRLGPDRKTCLDPCKIKRGGCSQLCKSNMDFLTVTCSCKDGFTLQQDGRFCRPSRCPTGQMFSDKARKCVGKCEVRNGGCGHTTECKINRRGKVACTCPEGEIMLKNGKVCARKCGKGFVMDMKRGVCKDINECMQRNGGCQDKCVNTAGGRKCLCRKPKYAKLKPDGKSCYPKHIPVADPCKVRNAGCQHICVSLRSKIRCECKRGYVLNNDKKTCTHACRKRRGGCGQAQCTVSRLTGKVTCFCKKGRILLNSGQRCAKACRAGYTLNKNTGKCLGPCSRRNGGCQDRCRNIGGRAICSCPNGGHIAPNRRRCVKCDKGFKFVRGRCRDINECARRNGGCEQLCKNIVGDYECACRKGELAPGGKRCTVINPCKKKNGGCDHNCVHEGNHKKYECTCKKGYLLDTDKHSCINKCRIKNGGCGKAARCRLRRGVPRCSCKPGYVRDRKRRRCRNVCKQRRKVCHQYCSIKKATRARPYTCSCNPGFVMVKNKCVEGCKIRKQGCQRRCVNRFDGRYKCRCNKGERLNKNGKTCDDINECKRWNGRCSHKCINKKPGHVCVCPKTMELAINGRTCITYNPCKQKKRVCSHKCVHEGITRKYRCECRPGWRLASDKKTCIDKCKINNGGCMGGKCKRTRKGRIVCKCKKGFKLIRGKLCEDINECANKLRNPCDDNCHNTKGSFRCSCRKGRTLGVDRATCTPVNPCRKRRGGCSHKCVTKKGRAHCVCPANMKLTANRKTCKHVCDIKNNGCQHICVRRARPVVCKCRKGFQLRRNGKSCKDINECRRNTDRCEKGCKNTFGGFKCTCPKGMAVDRRNRRKCKDINECRRANGGCSQRCINKRRGYKCACRKGFKLTKNKRTCKDIKECSKPDKGGCSQICVEKKGWHKCKCRPGFKLLMDRKTCVDIPECSRRNGGCAQVCNERRGGYRCSCRPGFKLAADRRNCKDINECKLKPRRCQRGCENLVGSYRCRCPKGFVLSKDRRTCKDKNECDRRNGGCSHKCVNKVGSYRCKCPKGFRLDVDKRRCIDVNECERNKGGCQHKCRNTKGSYKCRCRKGYRLMTDRKRCKDINECKTKLGKKCTGKCKNKAGGYKCICPLGMKVSANGFSCDRVRRCRGNKRHGCDHKCRDPGAGKRVICSCRKGFKLQRDRKTCKDINECKINNGGCRQKCVDIPGSYRCECDDPNICKKGYAHDEKTDQCIEIVAG